MSRIQFYDTVVTFYVPYFYDYIFIALYIRYFIYDNK